MQAISSEEFQARRKRAREQAEEKGLAGLVVFSRGGTTVDFYGDVMYLSNFHSTFPALPDAPSWSARGHAALVLPTEGEPVLVTDYLDGSKSHIEVDDVRETLQVPGGVGKVLAELGLAAQPLGLVGAQCLALPWFREMEAEAGRELDFAIADEILERMRSVKSSAELSNMREAAAVGVEWMRRTLSCVEEGRRVGEAVGEGLSYLASQGGMMADVAVAGGTDHNPLFGSTSVPHWDSRHVFQEGELLHVDQWGPVNNYFTDFGRSLVVGGNPTDAQREVLEASVLLVEHLLDGIRPGVTFDAIHRRGQDWLSGNGFATATLGLFGHSLGLNQESPWIVAGEEAEFEADMVIAVEAFVERPGVGASNFEQNVIVRDGSPEILTAACPSRWW